MNTNKTDARLRDDVANELDWDMRIDASRIDVSARAGLITLSGIVRSYPQKLAAAEAAHRVAGVLDVANELEVHLPGTAERSDVEIATAVRSTLEWDIDVPDDKITSTVVNGVVELSGEVASSTEHAAVLRAIRNLAGVKAVVNNIRVAGQTLQTRQVEQAIRAAFARHAQRDAEHIHIEIIQDTATLSGVVHSWAERQAALGAARGTRGIHQVVDRLTYDPYNSLR
jgi:osmotically-inducible protein OsmY